MHTDLEIVARPGRSPRVTATGGLAARTTGPDSVHLVSTAATPLGGDTIAIRVILEDDAVLRLRTVAATIALPSIERIDSRADWTVEVGDGARLHLDPQPTVVAAGAEHHTATRVIAHSEAMVIIAEHAQLGRAEESPEHAARARWQGSLRVDIGDSPVLRHRLALGGVAGAGHRAVGSVFRYPDARPAAVSADAYATRLELARPAGIAGATLTTALAASTGIAGALCDELDLAPTMIR
ncbi:urease accessory protein UreD [Gordonia insulae]|uniref:Urease accessory protein UreD n=1 Tax=Gordonia insulae TaxID=2420509 RepID=A0A3G8JI96_9ACTN|nr:urease accessory protein UreD [Gordonia insulae]AZG44648.1 Urease accessory protein UreD [Gordonia insulae]